MTSHAGDRRFASETELPERNGNFQSETELPERVKEEDKQVRLFFGVDVTPAIRSQMADVQSKLQAHGVRAGNWSRPELFHLTLLFIGATPDEHVSELVEMGKQAVSGATPFTLSFLSPGMFEKNRILWYGVKEDEGMASLRDINRRIVGLAKEKPFIDVDERPYRPHLTLARKLETASIPAVRQAIQSESFPIDGLPVSSICLFESRQVNGQLMYPIVERFEFGM